MKEYRKIFVICRKDGDIEHSDNYCKHGPMGEMEDAIGYGTLLDARKFLTSGDAQAYIDRELPAWGRPLHHPVGRPTVFRSLQIEQICYNSSWIISSRCTTSAEQEAFLCGLQFRLTMAKFTGILAVLHSLSFTT